MQNATVRVEQSHRRLLIDQGGAIELDAAHLRFRACDELFSLAEFNLVLLQPTFQDLDRREEVMTAQDQQVDVVGVLLATKTMRQVIAWIHRRAKFPAMGTLEPKIAFELFRDRTVMAQPRDN